MKSFGVEAANASPGPATYEPYPKPYIDNCLDEFRQLKRRTSRQTRFMDAVLRKSLLNGKFQPKIDLDGKLRDVQDGLYYHEWGGPGPAAYDPRLPSCSPVETCRQYGQKQREQIVRQPSPGPADYNITLPLKPHPTFYAPFGRLSLRFVKTRDDNPGPSDYTQMRFGDSAPAVKHCLSSIAFGSSMPLTRPQCLEYKISNLDMDKDEIHTSQFRPCMKLSPAFACQTPRFQEKKTKTPSPAAYCPTVKTCMKKCLSAGGFCSAEPRFQNRWDWLTPSQNPNTPGPGMYEMTLLKSGPRQTFSKSERFMVKHGQTPAPNHYGIFLNINNMRKIPRRKPNAPVILETFYFGKPIP